MARRLVNRASVRPPAASTSASISSWIAASASRAAAIRERNGAVQEPVRLVGERAADVELDGGVAGRAHPGWQDHGQRRARHHYRHGREHLGRHGLAHVQRCGVHRRPDPAGDPDNLVTSGCDARGELLPASLDAQQGPQTARGAASPPPGRSRNLARQCPRPVPKTRPRHASTRLPAVRADPP